MTNPNSNLPYDRAALERAVEQNNILAVVDVLKTYDLTPTQQQEVVASVLVFSPLRVEMLDEINKTLPIAGLDVLAQATRFHYSFKMPEWDSILDWYEDKFGDETPRFLAQNFNEMAGIYTGAEQRGLSNRNVRQGMLKMLDRHPELIHELEPTSHSYLCLFKLSAHKNAGNWLEKSGKVEPALYWGIRTKVVSHMLNDESGLISMDQWLAKSPAHQQAWDNIVSRDTELLEKHTSWLEKWLPGGICAGSPLEQWTNQTRENPDGWMQRDSPLAHALFQDPPLPLDGNEEIRAAITYESFIRREKNPITARTRLISANEQLLQGRNSGHRALLDVPAHKLSLAMLTSFSEAKQIMKNSQNRDELAKLLEDPRMRTVVSMWKINDVLRWALTNHWKDWTNKQGQGLLELSLGCGISADKPNTSLLCRLAKEKPKWFIESSGMNLIKRLGLDEKASVPVLKAALEGVAKVSKSPKTQTPAVKKLAM